MNKKLKQPHFQTVYFPSRYASVIAAHKTNLFNQQQPAVYSIQL